MKWVEGAKQGIVVAGGQGEGNGLTQLSYPNGVVVDQLGTVYVADNGNHRIVRWRKGATQGSVIVGENGGGGGQSNQLYRPDGLSFDRNGNLYVVEYGNDRVQKFNIENTGNKLHIQLDRFNIRMNDQQLLKISGEGWNSVHLKSNC
jgi:sugar lactone lactonase YvrE